MQRNIAAIASATRGTVRPSSMALARATVDSAFKGNMIAGFALIAFPADYGNSGIMTFVCNHQGKVYQKDLGEDSDLIAGGVVVYDPDTTWSQVR